MICLGIIIITGILLFLAAKSEGVGFGVFIGIIGGIFIGAILFAITCRIVENVSETEYYLTESKPIYALQDNSQLKGSFFLGCGTVDEEMKYVYTENDENGAMMKTIEVENVRINERKNCKPSIDTYQKRYKNEFLKNNFITFGSKTVINVPAGTIKYNFKIDLQ